MPPWLEWMLVALALAGAGWAVYADIRDMRAANRARATLDQEDRDPRERYTREEIAELLKTIRAAAIEEEQQEREALGLQPHPEMGWVNARAEKAEAEVERVRKHEQETAAAAMKRVEEAEQALADLRKRVEAEAKQMRKVARQIPQPGRYELQEASRRLDLAAKGKHPERPDIDLADAAGLT